MTNLHEFFQEKIAQRKPCSNVGFLTQLRQYLIEIHCAVFSLDALLKNRSDVGADIFIFGSDLYDLHNYLNALWSEFVLIANQLSDFSQTICFISLEEQADSNESAAHFDLNDITEYINYTPKVDPAFCEVVLILDRAEKILELCNSYWEPYIQTDVCNRFLGAIGGIIGLCTVLLRRSTTNLAIYRKAILLRDLLLAIFDLPDPTNVFRGIESDYVLMLSLITGLMAMQDGEIISLHKLFYESVQDDIASSSDTAVLCGLLILLQGLKISIQNSAHHKSIMKRFLDICKGHLNVETYKILIEHSKFEDIKVPPESIDIENHVNNLYFDLVEDPNSHALDSIKALATIVRSAKSVPIEKPATRCSKRSKKFSKHKK